MTRFACEKSKLNTNNSLHSDNSTILAMHFVRPDPCHSHLNFKETKRKGSKRRQENRRVTLLRSVLEVQLEEAARIKSAFNKFN